MRKVLVALRVWVRGLEFGVRTLVFYLCLLACMVFCDGL